MSEAAAPDAPTTPTVAGVRFQRAGKVYYFDGERAPELAVGDEVIVDTARGRELGRVVIAPGQVLDPPRGRLKAIVRKASEEDLEQVAALRAQEGDALRAARKRIAERGLPMKPVVASYNYDGSRLTIYFVSEKRRVDFRQLVRDLATDLRTRVMLRQVGPRDQAKMIGGIDRCGRELCCSTWMPEFQPISIRMAKTQNLPLNPSEISGVCGKLLCCLAFEDDLYRDMRTGLPKVGARLTSAVGRGRVVDVSILTRKITISWETGSRVEVDADEFLEQQERWKRATNDAPKPGSEERAEPQRSMGGSRGPDGSPEPREPAAGDAGSGGARAGGSDESAEDGGGGTRKPPRRGRRRGRRRRKPRRSSPSSRKDKGTGGGSGDAG